MFTRFITRSGWQYTFIPIGIIIKVHYFDQKLKIIGAGTQTDLIKLHHELRAWRAQWIINQ